jgi:hypothetical protein
MAKILILSKGLFLILFTSRVFGQQFVPLPAGNCSVYAADTFHHRLDSFQTPVGNLIYHTYYLSDSGLYFQLAFVDYPEETIHSDSLELLNSFFDEYILAQVERLKGTKRYESIIQQFEFPGRYWKIDFGADQFVRTKSFVAGRRLYTLQVTGLRKKDNDKKIQRFFDSFRFINPSKIE